METLTAEKLYSISEYLEAEDQSSTRLIAFKNADFVRFE